MMLSLSSKTGKRFRQALAILLSLAMIVSLFTVYPSHMYANENAFAPFTNPDSFGDMFPNGDLFGQHSIPNPTARTKPQLPQQPDPFQSIQPNQQQDFNLPSLGQSHSINIPSTHQNIQNPVNPGTGLLQFTETDLAFSGINYGFELSRTYQSDNQDMGPFGRGWVYPLESRIKLHAEYDISEFRIDGSTQPFTFVITDEEAYITSYDGDDLINYELDKGYYEVSETGDKLERISQHEYLITTPNGNKYTYYSYQAPWREDQDPREGRMIKQEDRYGNAMTFDYNSEGDVSSITDMVGRTVKFVWSGGVISQMKDPMGHTTTYEYDFKKRLKKVIREDGTFIRYGYDHKDRLDSVTDAENNTYRYAYNDQDQVTQVVSPEGKTIYSYIYDSNRVQKKDILGNTWVYEVNDDNVVREMNPIGEVSTYSYDEDGNLLQQTSPRGTVSIQYDQEGRKQTESLPSGQTVTYDYHEKWNSLTNINDESGRTMFLYDEMGNVEKRIDSKNHAMSFGYNSKGQREWVESDLKNRTEFDYDQYGNVSKVKRPLGIERSFSYDTLGRLKEEKRTNGSKITYTHTTA
jgi:YD repeat-containing protein